MTATLHKILIHGGILIQSSKLTVGMLAEEASEYKNKVYKSDRLLHTRKHSRLASLSDLFYRSMDCSDPLISLLYLDKCVKHKCKIPKEALELLEASEGKNDEADSDSDADSENLDLELSEEE